MRGFRGERDSIRTQREPSADEEDPFGFFGEYSSPKSRGQGWGLLSFLFFLAAIFSRFVVGALPGAWTRFPGRVLLAGLAVPIFSSLGIVLGLIGMRFPTGRRLARLGVGANLIALVLSLLLIAAFFRILPRSYLQYFFPR